MDFQDKNYHWISMLEASRLCAYSQEYLSLLARRGKLFSKKFGRNWYTTREAVDDYLDMCEKRKITPETPFKGSLNVRLGPELHRRIAFAATARHISINKYIAEQLDRVVDE